MIFRKKKTPPENLHPKPPSDPLPTILPEVSVADLPTEVNIVINQSHIDDAVPEFPISDVIEPLIITEAPSVSAVAESDIDTDSGIEVADAAVDRISADDEAFPSNTENAAETDVADEVSPVADGKDEADIVESADDEAFPSNTENAAETDVADEVSPVADGKDKAVDATSAEEEGAEETAAEEEPVEECPLNDFEKSIRDFSKKDIDTTVESGGKKRDFVRLAVMLLCACVFLYSTSYLVRNIHDKIKSDRIYAEIIDSVADGFAAEGIVVTGGKVNLLAADTKTAYTPTMDEIIKNGAESITTQSDHSAELAKMRASLESLRNINPDIYAWIKVPGTNINYPVAKTDNNEYYLDHAYTGDNLVNGSIYADFRCVLPITDNYNTVLYGHNVTSGSMFNHVTQFFKPEVFESTNIYVYTFDGIYIFKPFSIHEAAFDSGYVDMGFDGEEFVAFANSLAEMSDIKTDITFTPGDRLITLSTCTNGISTQRYALHGVLIETITQ